MPTPRITSRLHPFVKRCRDLAAGRGEPGEVLLDGAHVIEEAIAAKVRLLGLLTNDATVTLARQALGRGCPVLEGTEDVLAAASPVRTPSGIIAVGAWAPAAATDLVRPDATLLIGLVNIQDPGNVGSIIRTADALGASGALALDATAHPGSWKALRGAMGSTFRLPIGRGASDPIVQAAKAAGMTIAAATVDRGHPIDRWPADGPVLVLVGNEGSGLPQPIIDAADVRLTIPMRSGINSLNVGVSAALLLWEALRVRRSEREWP